MISTTQVDKASATFDLLKKNPEFGAHQKKFEWLEKLCASRKSDSIDRQAPHQHTNYL
jgi:hypothetical protein